MISGIEVFTESSVLALFLIGLLVSIKLKRRWHVTEIISMYALGLLFEILTSHMWIYHNIFLIFPFSEDISVTFPANGSFNPRQRDGLEKIRDKDMVDETRRSLGFLVGGRRYCRDSLL